MYRSVNPFTATEEEVTIFGLISHILVKLWYVIFLIFYAMPYLLYGEVRDCLIRAVVADRVWIEEVNPHLEGYPSDPEPGIPEFPSVNDPDPHGRPCYYAKLSSVRAAEDWLLKRGYEKQEILHRKVPFTTTTKTFPVKTMGRHKSIICVIVDYGDGDFHFIPFRYPEGKSPFDFSRFRKVDEEFGPRVQLPWQSTDGTGSHMFGGHVASNHDYPFGEER